MKNLVHPMAVFLAVLFLMVGCGKRGELSDHDHFHAPPHGGVAVELGLHEYQLEFVLDANAGRMTAYVLSGHMDTFVRIAVDSFDVRVLRPEGERVLMFKAVANPATGETIGDTSQFEAAADWLKDIQAFHAELDRINIKDNSYERVGFRFVAPK